MLFCYLEEKRLTTVFSPLLFLQGNEVNYDFSWAVKDDYTGNDYGHSENRRGYDTSGGLTEPSYLNYTGTI